MRSFPFILKARKGAYDGKGNAVVDSADGVEAAFAALGGQEVYAEKWCPYEKELAVMVVRGANGQVRDGSFIQRQKSSPQKLVLRVHKKHIFIYSLFALLPLTPGLGGVFPCDRVHRDQQHLQDHALPSGDLGGHAGPG